MFEDKFGVAGKRGRGMRWARFCADRVDLYHRCKTTLLRTEYINVLILKFFRPPIQLDTRNRYSATYNCHPNPFHRQPTGTSLF